jgi:uncharacterized membrane protein
MIDPACWLTSTREIDPMNQKSTATKALGLALTLGAVGVGALLTARAKATKPSPDDAPDYTGRHASGDLDVTGCTVTIGKPRQELYDHWRNFQNLPTFMENLLEIRPVKGQDRANWRIRAPAGHIVDVVTEVAEDRKGEVIAWRSVEGSEIETTGRVTFTDAPGARGTRVSLIIEYKPPAGAMGRIFAKAFRREPQIQSRHDLKRFKMLMETGEIATSARTKDQTRKAKMEEEA